jgi:hypothetical protein
MIEYVTVPAVQPLGAQTEYPKWLAAPGADGGEAVIHPDLGNTSGLDGDLNYWIRRDGDIQELNDVEFGSETKDGLNTLWCWGNEGGIYPPSNLIDGFAIKRKQRYTGGHSMFLRRVLLHHMNDAGKELIWGSSFQHRATSTEWETWGEAVTQADRNKLIGYKFYKLTIQASTLDGEGSKRTQSKLEIGNFTVTYTVGPVSTRWVIGEMRTRDNRNGAGSIQINS